MKSAIDGNNMFFNMFGLELVQSFLIYNAKDPEKKIEETIMQEAYEAGKKLIG